jgi:hypothetical protein
MAHKKRLKTTMFLPLVLVGVLISTLVFGFAYQGGLGEAAEETPAPPVETPPIDATPEPVQTRLFAFQEGGKWGFKDQEGTMKIAPKFDKVFEFGVHEVTIAAINGGTGLLYGVIDEQGNWVGAQPQFNDARAFSEGYAAVRQGDNWGYVDENGRTAVTPVYASAGDFSEGVARVSQNQRFGYIDATGAMVIANDYVEAYDFSEGRAFVAFKEETGTIRNNVIDTAGTPIGGLDQKQGIRYSNGLAAVRLDEGSYTYYNTTIRQAFEKTFAAADSFSDGLAAVKVDGKWGYIGTDGEYAIQPRFEAANAFSDGLAAVKVDSKWGYINTAGQFVIPNQYDEAGNFLEGYAVVRAGTVVQCVDKDGAAVQLYTLAVEPDALGDKGTIKVDDRLNVRKSPSTDADVVTKLSNGTEVTILETLEEWYKIDADGLVGYVKRSYVTR